MILRSPECMLERPARLCHPRDPAQKIQDPALGPVSFRRCRRCRSLRRRPALPKPVPAPNRMLGAALRATAPLQAPRSRSKRGYFSGGSADTRRPIERFAGCVDDRPSSSPAIYTFELSPQRRADRAADLAELSAGQIWSDPTLPKLLDDVAEVGRAICLRGWGCAEGCGRGSTLEK